MPSPSDRHRALYDAHAAANDARRARVLFERGWLDRWLAHLPPGGRLLDAGCGAGEPIARYLIASGYAVVGVDFAPAMLALARRRFPEARWVEQDLRALDVDGPFDGLVAWDSFFHLTPDEQRAALPRLTRHLTPGGALLVTVGPSAGETTGCVEGHRVYHASLSAAEYGERLSALGYPVERFVADDPSCDGHSVLLARGMRRRST